MLTRVPSSLPENIEDTLHRIIGCALEVHEHLGPGYLESIYKKAMQVELSLCGMPFETERCIQVAYKGHVLHGQRIDLIVAGLAVLELKAVSRLEPIHQSQLVSYLSSTGLRAGLLINFNTRWLRDGIKRVVL